jgi:hypothetical protein
MKLRKAQTVRGERGEIRRADFAAVAAEIGKAHVINQNYNDVRPGRNRFVRTLEAKSRAFSNHWKSQRRDTESGLFQKFISIDRFHCFSIHPLRIS